MKRPEVIGGQLLVPDHLQRASHVASSPVLCRRPGSGPDLRYISYNWRLSIHCRLPHNGGDCWSPLEGFASASCTSPMPLLRSDAQPPGRWTGRTDDGGDRCGRHLPVSRPRDYRQIVLKRKIELPPEHLYPADDWRIVEARYSDEFVGLTETVFSLGNGFVGVRGSMEEGRPALVPGTFVNGFHETWPIMHATAVCPSRPGYHTRGTGSPCRFGSAGGRSGSGSPTTRKAISLRRAIRWRSSSGGSRTCSAPGPRSRSSSRRHDRDVGVITGLKRLCPSSAQALRGRRAWS